MKKIKKPEFKKDIDQKFFWIQVTDDDGVLAFDKVTFDHVKNVDNKAIIETQILNVLVPIFEGLGWGRELIEYGISHNILMDSQIRKRLLTSYGEELVKFFSAREINKRRKENGQSKL